MSSKSVKVEIVERTYEGEFTTWEATLWYLDEIICECTGPTFYGVLDCVMETLENEGTPVDLDWLRQDSNKN
jgi:hypothetical protein